MKLPSVSEAMALELSGELGLNVLVHGLSAVVPIERRSSPAQKVRHVFEVMRVHVIKESRAHMRMVWAWPQTREQLRPCYVVEVSTELPGGSDYYEQKQEYQRDALGAVLYERGVHMHVILGGEVVVDHCIHVLQVHKSCVLVLREQFRIWPVEMAAATATHSQLDGPIEPQRLGSESLSQQEKVRVATHFFINYNYFQL